MRIQTRRRRPRMPRRTHPQVQPKQIQPKQIRPKKMRRQRTRPNRLPVAMRVNRQRSRPQRLNRKRRRHRISTQEVRCRPFPEAEKFLWKPLHGINPKRRILEISRPPVHGRSARCARTPLQLTHLNPGKMCNYRHRKTPQLAHLFEDKLEIAMTPPLPCDFQLFSPSARKRRCGNCL